MAPPEINKIAPVQRGRDKLRDILGSNIVNTPTALRQNKEHSDQAARDRENYVHNNLYNTTDRNHDKSKNQMFANISPLPELNLTNNQFGSHSSKQKSRQTDPTL